MIPKLIYFKVQPGIVWKIHITLIFKGSLSRDAINRVPPYFL
jgi:hypothetical protein